MSIQTELSARDACNPASFEWGIHNRTAWKLYLHEINSPPCEWASHEPPADFGPAYLEPQLMAAE